MIIFEFLLSALEHFLMFLWRLGHQREDTSSLARWLILLIVRLAIAAAFLALGLWLLDFSRPGDWEIWSLISGGALSLFGGYTVFRNFAGTVSGWPPEWLTYMRKGAVARRLGPLGLEQRLALLAECGIRLNDGFGADDLRKAATENALADDDVYGLLKVMGGFGRAPDAPPLSDDIYYYDLDRPREAADFERFMDHMSRIAQGAFTIDRHEIRIDPNSAHCTLDIVIDGDKHTLSGRLMNSGNPHGALDTPALAALFRDQTVRGGRELKCIEYEFDRLNSVRCYVWLTHVQERKLKKLGVTIKSYIL